ncbi:MULTISPECIES: nucleotide sugar dehydrogenase [Bacillus]|uniref:nucleotide sugar dehydrogenase n=1 Tax=Bacillus TaxID=1386 RepID=UPI0010A58B8A|nr:MULTISPECIES: nucleotide sugar dehydrogenase [Bacillus]MDA4081806.1 nucleotide sugar dehydrogenase [Bacillus cereus]QCC43345.1 UDP-N-acetyl-D-mannosamine dehydrogenase [Bacillus sp. DU-106]
MNKKVCVVGLGYIGLPTSAIFAKAGYDVIGVDVNPVAIEMINQGKVHIEEVGLGELVKDVVEKGKLSASVEPTKADVFIIAVPTPHNADHTANLDYVVEATKSILPFLQKESIVIVESTIPPRTIDDIVAPIIEEQGWKVGEEIYLAHCPERVLPGRILIELVENTRIVGGINKKSTQKAAEVYGCFVKGEILETTAVTAEMSKLMENTFRDVNIALANELAKISEKLGVNALEVIKLANHHPRVNLHLPGPGVGGHCLAVDPYFIIEKAPEESQLISNARFINNSMPVFVVEQLAKIIPDKNAKVAVLGITYKGNIDDVRESPAMTIVDLLKEQGYEVAVHDPHVHENQVHFNLYSLENAVKNAECILVLTDHNEFKKIDEQVIIDNARKAIIFDTRNCMNISSKQISYYNFNNLYELRSLASIRV